MSDSFVAPRPTPPDKALLDTAHKTVDRLFGQLDWGVLADVYCDEGGEAYWAVHRGPARRSGVELGRAAVERLAPGGTSLWVGAGVAEIGVLVFEAIVRERQVVACNLRGAECEVLNHALRAVGLADRLTVDAVDATTEAAAVAEDRSIDHLGMISVLTDPERFPQLAGVTYGRTHPLFVDTEALVDERERAKGEARAWLGALSLPAVVTTSVEEVAWVMDWAGERVRVDADDDTVESAVVGDPVGFLYLQEAGGKVE